MKLSLIRVYRTFFFEKNIYRVDIHTINNVERTNSVASKNPLVQTNDRCNVNRTNNGAKLIEFPNIINSIKVSKPKYLIRDEDSFLLVN